MDMNISECDKITAQVSSSTRKRQASLPAVSTSSSSLTPCSGCSTDHKRRRIADPSQRVNLSFIVVKIQVNLSLGPLDGDLGAELSFFLMYPISEEVPRPAPDSAPHHDQALVQLDPHPSENGQEQDDDIIFQDFARLQLNAADSEA